MKINELIVNEQVEEGIGQAIGKAWGGAMKGVGAVGGGLAGSWDAMKQGYNAGKAAVSGRVNPDDSDPTLAKNAPAAQGGAPAGNAAPAAQGGAPAAQGGAPAAQGGAPAAQGGAPAGNAAPAAQGGAPEMKSAEIVDSLKGVWDKATANQGSQTSAPQVQQQIRAMGKAAGMAGQTVESKKTKKVVAEFRSNFLGIVI